MNARHALLKLSTPNQCLKISYFLQKLSYLKLQNSQIKNHPYLKIYKCSRQNKQMLYLYFYEIFNHYLKYMTFIGLSPRLGVQALNWTCTNRFGCFGGFVSQIERSNNDATISTNEPLNLSTLMSEEKKDKFWMNAKLVKNNCGSSKIMSPKSFN